MDDKVIFARAMPPPVDVAVDGYFAGKLTAALKQELLSWALISVAALGLAGLLAILLVVAKMPGVERALPFMNQAFFQRGLVAHVTFAFVVWYLGMLGAFTVLVTAGLSAPSMAGMLFGRIGVAGAALSFLLLLAPVLIGRGDASPNDYIPVLTDPLYFGGLVLLGASVALPILRLLLTLARERRVEPTTFGVAAAGVIYLIALTCFALAWLTRPVAFDVQGINEYLMWGGGHVLQFVNTGLFLCALYLLTRVAFGETPLAPRLFKGMMLLLVAAAAIAPLLYVTYEGGDPGQRLMFTMLYRCALPLPVVVVCGAVIALVWRRRHDLWSGAPEIRGIAAALILFACGGVIGFFENSVDTRTPAHYHAELIAVTLIFMALTFAVVLPLLDRRSAHRRLRATMYLTLGGGQFLHSTGLFIDGALGVARKTAGAAQGLDSADKVFAGYVMALGGAIAVVGGVIFIVLAGKMLLAKAGRGVTATPLTGAGAA